VTTPSVDREPDLTATASVRDPVDTAGRPGRTAIAAAAAETKEDLNGRADSSRQTATTVDLAWIALAVEVD
jgi:hypothetical protein